MKYILLISMLMWANCFGQYLVVDSNSPTTMGFIYSKGIVWTENKKQDSVLKIIVEGDTMTAIRNLLLYCMQEKEENEHAYDVLSHLNLEYLSTFFKDKDFDFYLKEYRKVIAKNNLKRGIKPKKKK